MPHLDDDHRDEYERLKQELEVDDDEIKAYNGLKNRFQRMILRVTGTDRDRKMLQLGQILKRRQEYSQVLGNKKKDTPVQVVKDEGQPLPPAPDESPLAPEDPHARFDFVEFGRDFRIDSATFESLERICGRDFCKWRLAKVFIKALKSSYCISEHMHAFEQMIEKYCFAPTFEMNARWLEIYARRAFMGGKQNEFFITLEKAKKMAKGDTDKFNLYLNILDFSPETLMSFMETQTSGHWNERKMAIMASYETGLTAEKMKTIFKCYPVYGGDDRIFKAIADYVVANVKLYPDRMVEGLIACKSDWVAHPERFISYIELAKDGLIDVIRELLNVSEMTREHPKRFERLATLGRIGKRGRIIAAMAEHRKLFEQDERMFEMLCEVGTREKENGISNIHELARAKRICDNNPELFEICHNLIKKGNRIGTGLLLSNRDLFEGMPERIPVLLKILESNMAIQYLNEIKDAKPFYAEKKERFFLVAHLLLNGGVGKVRPLIEITKQLKADDEMVRLLADLYQYQASEILMTNLKRLRNLTITNDLLKELTVVCGQASEKSKHAPMMVPYLQCLDMYANEPEALKEIRRLPNEVPNMLLAMEILNHFQTNNKILAKKVHRMRIMTKLGKEGKDEAVKALKIAVGIYQDNDDLYDFFLETSETRGYEMVQKLCNSKNSCDKDLENYRIAIIFFDLGLEHGDKILGTFIGKYALGKDRAMNYIKEIQEQAKSLIGPSIPKEARQSDRHSYLVSLVFPSGNYSNYDRNLACGDRLEHLEPFKYDRSGYPTEMTGVRGYVLREGEADDQELLNSYVNRLGNMRNFIQSRGPNNEALQAAYEAKIDKLCQENLREEFRQIKELTVKEKMLCLFTGEIMKKHAQKNYRAMPEIFDLVVEYKYAYQDNLEAYVQRSADTTRQMRDPESQRYNLWYELSNIYGENLKHVIRHDLLAEDVLTGENYALIEKNYAAILGEKVERNFKPKQKTNFMNTFANEHIPEKGYFDEKKNKQVQGRYETLVRQAVIFFSANVKFENDEEKETYKNEIAVLMEGCKGKDLFKPEVFFEQIAPKLFALKNQKVLNLKAKLEELFSADINKISEEVAKFDEEVEVEAKETRIGGNKHKKVEKKAKRRKIRGFFTKTKETANARMGAYLCIAGDQEMWKNPNYFELVLKDEETGKCMGLVMFLNIEVPARQKDLLMGRTDGKNKKYLWFGPNPYESFLGQVSANQCYRYMYDTAVRFAEENGYDGVVVPANEGMILGGCTNRGGDFPELIKQSRIRDKAGNIKIIEFGQNHILSRGYQYHDGALIWERPKTTKNFKRLPPPLPQKGG